MRAVLALYKSLEIPFTKANEKMITIILIADVSHLKSGFSF